MIQPKIHCQILSSVNYGLIVLCDGFLKDEKQKENGRNRGNDCELTPVNFSYTI